ncbi:hypothetical protein BU24DRAFT_427105 [Aaosphaeria arxii CBS 175.79]|uniref:Methyltransferase n=1 Tax=Aaosphaeria arxii CBS 175.79 TaxID=1450172 RepID=A0A6A5XDM1_9PLEO|nr:uncharacterized protein BU24DRAFT_427105 [Aaosphaeria arxii CBS 175.79]KAF2010916.1 hypothetical protein BU24DRAFT_427105 [Aaosphaeria arxii CBS 175.79]
MAARTTTHQAKASIDFLAKDPFYDRVKPYSIHRSLPTTLPHDNLVREVHDVPLHDLRKEAHSLSFEENGIAVLEMASAMTYDDFEDRHKVEQTYCKEVADALLMYTNAASVQIFDCSIRKRHEAWPEKSSRELDGEVQSSTYPQPARQAHIDINEKETGALVKELNPFDYDRLLSGRYITLNVWRPLFGPLQDWPLAVCDAASVDLMLDFMDLDNIYLSSAEDLNDTPKKGLANLKVIENVLIHYNPAQRWHYLSDHQPSELLLFRQFDSTGKPGVPHASFYQQPVGTNFPRCRESVEVRVILYFE